MTFSIALLELTSSKTSCFLSQNPNDSRCLICQLLGLECTMRPIPSNEGYSILGDKPMLLGRTGGSAVYPEIEQDTRSSSTFWTQHSPKQRSGSVHSLSSSRNSSLHGYPIFDPQEQDPVFAKGSQRSASTDYWTTSPGLPPPPVELDQPKSLSCDICGETIIVCRRLEWQ